jgi:hypothetical protein
MKIERDDDSKKNHHALKLNGVPIAHVQSARSGREAQRDLKKSPRAICAGRAAVSTTH